MDLFQEVKGYSYVKDIGSGNFGVARLCTDNQTGEKVAIKYIERGAKIDNNVKREITNHRLLRHKNIVQFIKISLTETHLAIIMEYAAGGELFNRICEAGRFSENEARYFFQQLVSGVQYCHEMGICHRDLKLENTLLDDSPAPRLKICDFGYSKSSILHSVPKSTVGTPAYIAPEVLVTDKYNGSGSDVWSCGVTLYVMLFGGYPFEDAADPRNFRRTIQKIMAVEYDFPSDVTISAGCRDLLARIFVGKPEERITMKEIFDHDWFRDNLPTDLCCREGVETPLTLEQTDEEINEVVKQGMTVVKQPETTEQQDMEASDDDMFGSFEVQDDGFYDS